MNAPFVRTRAAVRLADAGDAAAVAGFLAAHPNSTPFHGSAWLGAVERATGHRALTLLCESDGGIIGVLPLHAVHSPLFGRALVSTGFAVGGGILAETQAAAGRLAAAAEELAARLASPSVELRGGAVPQGIGWRMVDDRHAGFVAPLQPDDDAQLLAIPRKQRAEVRKALSGGLTVRVGRDAQDRAAHYALYAESVRNLGTPVFPRALFAAVIEAFGDDADILTVLDGDDPVASVLSLYHRGAVMPYWGGGGVSARRLRANELLYFGLMRHARERGCDRFDFGRSKLGSGAYHFKRNWGFAPERLTYAVWTAGGCAPRDTDPTSPANRAKVALWQRLPLPIANRLGPLVARGLA